MRAPFHHALGAMLLVMIVWWALVMGDGEEVIKRGMRLKSGVFARRVGNLPVPSGPPFGEESETKMKVSKVHLEEGSVSTSENLVNPPAIAFCSTCTATKAVDVANAMINTQ
ncbi:hypothetical protein HNY73_007070 [Argiope bruennichi]|uniref:Uncharacterized protein n=1 Tax=Argiope bruennichi TaxID=94029 RepID=A0A8T0FHV2_ARGBR|nr:hypothetical protein HNY73_007070 [Argiope bruennichi]